MEPLTLVIGSKNYSSWSLRPWLALKQAGIDFSEICIRLDQPETAAQIRQYSPSGRVPVLLHGDLTVWDSLAICEYMAEQFPEHHWYPEDSAARAIARSVSAEMHSSFQALRTNMPMNCCAQLPGVGRTPEVQQDIERITDLWTHCRQLFGQAGPFLFGLFTIADAMYAPVVLRFMTYDVALDGICKAYAEAILGLPTMQAWLKAAEAE
ncbi:MAG: glutathione S-transferase family protein [Thermosynechococcaceae cyanobacterium]